MRGEDLKLIFEQVKEKLVSEWTNSYTDESYKQVMDLQQYLMIDREVSKKEMSRLLEKYSYEDFEKDNFKFLKSGKQVWSLQGTFEEPEKMVEQASLLLDLKSADLSSTPKPNALKLTSGEPIKVQQPLIDDLNENSCNLSYFEIGSKTNMTDKMITMLLWHYMGQQYFNEMRTKKQLGYVVFMRACDFDDTIGIQFVIQSATMSCNYIMDQLDGFLEDMQPKINDISLFDFETLKGGMRVSMMQKENSMAQEFEENLFEISSKNLIFNRKELEIEALEQLSLETFQKRFEQIFRTKNSKRIDLQILSKNHHVEQEMQEEYDRRIMYPEDYKKLA